MNRSRAGVLLLAAAGASWGGGFLVFLFSRNWVWLVVGGAAGVVSYTASAIVLRRMSGDERDQLVERWTRGLAVGGEAFGKAMSGGWSLPRRQRRPNGANK